MKLPASQARSEFSELVNDVAFRGERVVLQRHGKDVAAIVPIADFELLEELENRIDLDLARKALKETGSRVPFDKLKRELVRLLKTKAAASY